MFRYSKTATDPGLPMTIAATFLDGLVLSLTPFHNSCNYRSAVVYGYAELVQDEDEALYAMKLITENLLEGRWDRSRAPPTQAELRSTSILRVRVQSASAKIRVGGPSEDRADLKNGELVKGTWTGVVSIAGLEMVCIADLARYRIGARGGSRLRGRRMDVKRSRGILSSGDRGRRGKRGRMRLRL